MASDGNFRFPGELSSFFSWVFPGLSRSRTCQSALSPYIIAQLGPACVESVKSRSCSNSSVVIGMAEPGSLPCLSIQPIRRWHNDWTGRIATAWTNALYQRQGRTDDTGLSLLELDNHNRRPSLDMLSEANPGQGSWKRFAANWIGGLAVDRTSRAKRAVGV